MVGEKADGREHDVPRRRASAPSSRVAGRSGPSHSTGRRRPADMPWLWKASSVRTLADRARCARRRATSRRRRAPRARRGRPRRRRSAGGCGPSCTTVVRVGLGRVPASDGRECASRTPRESAGSAPQLGAQRELDARPLRGAAGVLGVDVRRSAARAAPRRRARTPSATSSPTHVAHDGLPEAVRAGATRTPRRALELARRARALIALSGDSPDRLVAAAQLGDELRRRRVPAPHVGDEGGRDRRGRRRVPCETSRTRRRVIARALGARARSRRRR